ncbi:hypothetical protein BIFBIF_00433 [Bifidobacterium bifidum ATCC 29521 = JCM 1255 = DSM 20456]|nr:hypothetical protein BIFBIF_00433 [Bifidobacterium bifidum ATCC 29521 = JCM 1255 = DSM 20456]
MRWWIWREFDGWHGNVLGRTILTPELVVHRQSFIPTDGM